MHSKPPSLNPFLAVPKYLRGWVLPLALILLWWAMFHFDWANHEMFVPISEVMRVLRTQMSSGDFYAALGATLSRDAVGFVIGACAGLVIGGAMGLSRWVDRLIGPLFHAIKQVSHFAWIPLISVWFGMGDLGKIAFIALAAFFPMVLNTFEGVRSVNADLIDVARVYVFTPWQLFKRVIFPSAAPSILTGVQLALIYSWSAALGAEYLLRAGRGIGNLLIDGRDNSMMDLVIFGVLVVGLVGLLINALAHRIEARLLRWRSGSVAHY